MPISTIRTRIRQEFERHRYVNKLPVADVLLFKSHAEYQVRTTRRTTTAPPRVDFRGPGNNANARVFVLGDNELLEADHARHVVLQGGELPGRQEVAIELHVWIPRGEFRQEGWS